MTSSDAIRVMLEHLKDGDVALFTTGFISRRAFSVKDRHSNFYMIGSMGLVSSVGLGIALNTSKNVFIFDGDGSALMDLGTMAMISASRPDNLFHIVLDNEVYESTGRQPTISARIDLSRIAVSAGFKTVVKIADINKLKASVKNIMSKQGPVFILLKVSFSASKEDAPRVWIPPEKLTSRIKEALRKRS